MKTLTKKLKQKWIEALKSGKYKQGMSVLHSIDDDTYCWLGVLAAIDDDIKPGNNFLLQIGKSYDARSCIKGLPNKVQLELARMNDDVQSFEFIANYIEDNINPKR